MNTIIIRIPEPNYDLTNNTNIQWHTTENNEPTKQVANVGSVEDFSHYYQSLLPNSNSNRTVVLALPSTMVLYKNLQINQKHKKYLSSTLPYLLEEYLAENIEEMHIRYSQPNNASNYISVCAIRNHLIQKIIKLFNEYSIPLDSIIAEAQLFHTEKNSIGLFLDEYSSIIVNQEDQGITVNSDKIIHYLLAIQPEQTDLNTKDTDNAITKINFRYTAAADKKDISLITDAISKLSVEITPLNGTIINYISNSYYKAITNNCIVDLRQGIYACKRKIGRLINRWKPIGIALSCCLIINILTSTGLGFAYSHQQKNLWKTSIQKYIELFPKDQQAIRALQKQDYKFNVQKMLKNRMRSFDQSTADDTFLAIWQTLSNLIEESKLQSILKKIYYSADTKKIKLEFSNNDAQEIDKLKAIISQHSLDVQEYIKDKTKYLLVGKKV